MTAPRTVILVGAGHAHLHVARYADRIARLDVRVLLIDPGRFWYSGMATGMLAGERSAEEDQVDPAAVMGRSGEFIQDRVETLQARDRLLILTSGRTIAYDLVSINVGSEVPMELIEGAKTFGIPVKPLSNLWNVRQWVVSLAGGNAAVPRTVVVVGGGPTGCEVAANLRALSRRCGVRLRIVLVTRSPRLMPRQPASCGAIMEKLLFELDIQVLLSSPVQRLEEGKVSLQDGREVAADRVMLAHGLRASSWITRLGLPFDADGNLRVKPTLESTGDARVFGAGDCVQIEGHRLPKIGVYGVRAAPVLLRNLIARLEDRPLESYHPQRKYLSILNLGNGEGLAMRGSWCARGRWCLRLKNWLDRRWIARYQGS